jgi:hypothetical protein
VKQYLQEKVMGEASRKEEPPKIRFKDPIDPRKISIDGKTPRYDIKKDVTSVQANVTIGELLNDNPLPRACLIS